MAPEFVKGLLSMFGPSRPDTAQQEEDNAAKLESADVPRPRFTPAKRKPDLHPGRTDATDKRPQRQTAGNEEEKKSLFPDCQLPDPRTIPTRVLPNERGTSEARRSPAMKRNKPVSGGVRPTNTLRSNNFSTSKSKVPALEMVTSAGDNVAKPHQRHEERPAKRQKMEPPARKRALSDERPQIYISAVSDPAWFDREVASSPGLGGRKTSSITIDSQDSATPTQPSRGIFSVDESRDLHRTIAPKKKPRRPKASSGSASSSQIDRLEVIEILDSQPSQTAQMGPPPTTETSRGEARGEVPTDADLDSVVASWSRGVSNPLRTKKQAQPAIKIASVESQFDHLISQQEPTRTQKAQGSKNTSPSIRIDLETTPPMRKAFVRDLPSSSSKGSLRKGMLADSQAATTTVLAEESEDELSLGHDHQKTSFPRRKSTVGRTGSPSDMKTTKFVTTKKKQPAQQSKHLGQPESESEEDHIERFLLNSIMTHSVERTGKDLILLFYSSEKVFVVEQEGKSVLAPGQEPTYLLSNKHAKSVCANPEMSSRVQIMGAKDDVTGGEVWFEFINRPDVARFLEIIKDITYNKVTMKKASSINAIQTMYDNSRTRFLDSGHKPSSPTNPETIAIDQRAIGARERSRDVQKGITPRARASTAMSATPTVWRRSAMQSSFSDEQKQPEPRNSRVTTEPATTASQATSRSSRRRVNQDLISAQEREPKRWTDEHGIPRWEAPLTYPAGQPKATTTHAHDIMGLDDGQFLNDSIIAFCLRRLQEENPRLKDKVHIFDTFFYSILSSKDGRRAFNYDAVKRWTKKVDIFTFPFIVVPINVNLHWFVMIICNLDKLERTLTDDQPSPRPSSGGDMLDNDIEGDVEKGLPYELPDSQEERQTESVRDKVDRMSLSDGEGHTVTSVKSTGDATTFNSSGSPMPVQQAPDRPPTFARKGKGRAPPVRTLDSDQPAVITLDSLGGTHGTEVRHLKDYIIREGDEKRSMSIKREDIKGLVAKGIPEQTNHCDCGVYLIGYVTEFLKNPEEFARKALSRELDRNNDFADFDPAKKRADIRTDLIMLEKEQSEARRRQKKAKRDARLAESSKAATTATIQQANVAAEKMASSRESSKSRVVEPAIPASSEAQGMSAAGEQTARETLNGPADATNTAKQERGLEVDESAFLEGITEAAQGN